MHALGDSGRRVADLARVPGRGRGVVLGFWVFRFTPARYSSTRVYCFTKVSRFCPCFQRRPSRIPEGLCQVTGWPNFEYPWKQCGTKHLIGQKLGWPWSKNGGKGG